MDQHQSNDNGHFGWMMVVYIIIGIAGGIILGVGIYQEKSVVMIVGYSVLGGCIIIGLLHLCWICLPVCRIFIYRRSSPNFEIESP